MKVGKKAVSEIGIGIMIMGVLLLLGGIFNDSSFDSGSKYKPTDGDDKYDNENFLWYLNNTNLGRQVRETESFPNIELGSREKSDIIYIGNSFRLVSNMFSKNELEFDLSFAEPEDVSYILVYFKMDRLSGENPIIVNYNGRQVLKTLAKKSDLPLKIPVKINNPKNFTSMKISLELEKPPFYSLFNWNKVEFTDFKVLEVAEDKSNRDREFNFQIQNKEFLERVYIDLLVDCDNTNKVSDAIKVTVNDYIILNNNPDCRSKNTKITGSIPLNILNDEKNTVIFETDGFYKVGYGINKVYFNDKKNYKFNMNSYNGIGDVVMYGDFDRSYLDLRINSQTISLRRNEIKPILQYLRLGVNEIKILNDKVNIEELIIENNQYFD